jgi:hypothetical protein
MKRILFAVLILGGLGILVFGGATLATEPEGGAPGWIFFVPLIHDAPRPTPIPTPTPTATPPANLCYPIPGSSYGVMYIDGPATDRPAEMHADLNLALRSYRPAYLHSVGLLDNCFSVPEDYAAPQLRGLFEDHRRPSIMSVHWVFRWDWVSNSRSNDVEDAWRVSFLRVFSNPGEILHVPNSGFDLGEGYEALVLYASPSQITLKFNRIDSVVTGYTLHLEDICVDPALLDLYLAMNAEGRGRLPALRAGQAFARAHRSDFGIATRFFGAWYDPRDCAMWWRE